MVQLRYTSQADPGFTTGWPIIVHVKEVTVGNGGAFGMSGTNSTGQVPRLDSNSGMIDSDTPNNAINMKGSKDDDFTLVFSDEFNTEGRTFYEGDDRKPPSLRWGALNLTGYFQRTGKLWTSTVRRNRRLDVSSWQLTSPHRLGNGRFRKV